jgi:hypothetical protein
MNVASWRVHTYRMSGPAAQESVARLSARVDGLTVDSTGSPDHYLIVEWGRDLNQARSVHRLVTLSDPLAVRVRKTAPSPRRRRREAAAGPGFRRPT